MMLNAVLPSLAEQRRKRHTALAGPQAERPAVTAPRHTLGAPQSRLGWGIDGTRRLF
jgi:hypothetical protein